jgi:putative phosphoesterase
MRIAVISDIHANLEALTRTFDLIDRESVEEIVCLGDLVGYGANPNECLELVRSKCASVIKGNHDEAMVNPGIVETFTELARESASWTRRQLNAGALEYLASLPLKISKQNVLFVHASPARPEMWRYIEDKIEAEPLFDVFEEHVCCIGHTHIAALYTPSGKPKASEGERFIVNAGSVGQPRDNNPALGFGILDTSDWKYTQHRALYDVQSAAQKILYAQLPPFLAIRLLQGR